MSDLTSQDLGKVVRVATDKTKRELALPTKQPATVVEFHDSGDANVPRAMVHFDDAPADHTAMVKVHGGPVASGDRVHVDFQPPQGMAIDNRGSGTVGLELKCNAACGSSPTASVDFHLDAAARVGIIINAEAMGGWSIDGQDVTSPTSPFAVSTSYTFDAGDHAVAATGTGKDEQCVQILLIIGGTNTDDGTCVELDEPGFEREGTMNVFSTSSDSSSGSSTVSGLDVPSGTFDGIVACTVTGPTDFPAPVVCGATVSRDDDATVEITMTDHGTGGIHAGDGGGTGTITGGTTYTLTVGCGWSGPVNDETTWNVSWLVQLTAA